MLPSTKEKKVIRKQINERKQQVKETVQAARDITNLLDQYPAFQKVDRNELAAELRFHHSCSLPADIRRWAFELCRQNMKEIYASAWGWSDKRKLAELKHEDARFLVAYDASTPSLRAPQPLGYLHFRFETEGDAPVLYVYELQLEAHCQRRGLGRLLMTLAGLIAARTHMEAVMLTVMTANVSAAALYKKLGYTEHESSPEGGPDGPGYVILHKPIPTRRPGKGAMNTRAAGLDRRE